MLPRSSGWLNLVHVDGPQYTPETNSVTLKKEATRSLKRRNKIFALINMWSTPWTRVLLRKKTLLQVAMKFYVFDLYLRFLAIFKRAPPYLSLFWVRLIQSTPSHRIVKICLNIMFPSMLRSSKQSLSVRFLHQCPVCISLLFLICHLPRPFRSPNIFSEKHRS